MQPPYLSVSFWDSVRGTKASLELARDYLETHGAVILDQDEESIIVSGFPVSGLRVDGPARVEIVEFAPTSPQVEVLLPLGDLAERGLDNLDRSEWRALATDVADLILAINPEIAAVAFDYSAAVFPNPDFDSVYFSMLAGWIDLARCSNRQRLAFEALLSNRMASQHGTGAWWSTWPMLSLEENQPEFDQWVAAAAVYEALTGAAAPPEPERVPYAREPIVHNPQLWYWRPDARLEEFSRSFTDAIAPIGLEHRVRYDDYRAGWLTGLAEIESAQFLSPALLAQYRESIAQLRPKWSGIISISVDWPLGVVGPEGGDSIGPRVSDLWVDKAWAAPIVADLEELFRGAYREEFAGGILWITSASLVPDTSIDPSWTDESVGGRELEIAATLGRQVRRTIVDMYGPQPGLTEASIQE